MATYSSGRELQSAADYNIYDRGYRTGAQASVFIGPIWVEEIVSLQCSTMSEDMPVYPYSSPYHDRMLMGKYKVQGTIGITYTEPDYLLRIMEMARNVSIQDEELQDLIASRMSIFQNTVRHRLYTEALLSGDNPSANLTRYAQDYTYRISREVELQSLAGTRLSPRNFELTVIIGDLYGDTQAIEIFEDVKIVGTTKTIVNDDNSQIEIYSFVGRRKPERRDRVEGVRSRYLLVKENLLEMASQSARKLVQSLLERPSIKTIAPTARTALMVNTDKLAIAGLLNPKTRMYGKSASFNELTWALEYPLSYVNAPGDASDGDNRENYNSSTKLLLGKSDGSTTAVDVYLQPPTNVDDEQNQQSGFDNSYGKLVSIDRSLSANHLCAVGPVSPTVLDEMLGGSVALPRHREYEFETGSFIPPNIMEVESYSYTDDQIEGITMSTLWCCLTGFRGTATRETNRGEGTSQRENPGGQFITSVTQPLNTFAYIDSIKGSWTDAQNYEIRLSVPVYIDYINMHQAGYGSKRTKEEPSAGKTDKEVVFTVSGGSTSISVEGDDGVLTEIYQDVTLNWSRYEVEPDEEDETDLTPHFIEISETVGSERLASDFSKCVYATPFIFRKGRPITGVQHVELPGMGPGGSTLTYHQAVYAYAEDPEAPELSDDNIESWMAYRLEKDNGNDDSCNVDFTYDWCVKEMSGYMSAGQEFSIHGVQFMQMKEGKFRFRCPNCGEMVAIDDIYEPGSSTAVETEFNVIWLFAVLPINRSEAGASSNTSRTEPGTQENSEDLHYLHDIDSQAGRYVEIYNITRCDAQMMNLEVLAERCDGITDTLITAFRQLFNLDVPTQEYMVPVKANMNRIAAFLRGYGFRLNPENIVDELLRCTFTKDITAESDGTIEHPEGQGRDWTLRDALMVSVGQSRLESGVNNSAVDTAITELSSMVRSIIKEEMQLAGIRIYEEQTGRHDYMKAEYDLITPAPSVVSYGLTEDGYDDLSSISAANAQESESATGTPLTLGGYDV